MVSILRLSGIRHYVLLAIPILLAAIGSGHALLYKRDSRAAVLWVGFNWFAPLIGVLLYFVFGVNRIKRQALLLRGDVKHASAEFSTGVCSLDQLAALLSPEARHLNSLASAANTVATRPLRMGNRSTCWLTVTRRFRPCSMPWRRLGRRSRFRRVFSTATKRDSPLREPLGEAVRRGVDVRVLIDATGSRCSWPSFAGVLRGEGFVTRAFFPRFPSGSCSRSTCATIARSWWSTDVSALPAE